VTIKVNGVSVFSTELPKLGGIRPPETKTTTVFLWGSNYDIFAINTDNNATGSTTIFAPTGGYVICEYEASSSFYFHFMTEKPAWK